MSLSLKTSLKRLINALPSRVKVGKRYVGSGEPVFVIAEIGNNHNGDFELARETILAAKEAGADAVKFQKRDVDEVFIKAMQDMPYDNPRSLAPTYGEHRRKLEFDKDQFKALKAFSESLGMVFFVTPFDKNSADFLEDIGVDAYKIASFDIINLPLLEHVARKQKPILLSTGGSTLEEADEAIETILSINNRLIVNHCTSMYPTPDELLDLNVIKILKDRYHPLPIGYSGHERDILPSIVAVGLGTSTVERHFTLDKTMRGSDHHMSIEPHEFKEMVESLRRIEVAMGASGKQIHEGELMARQKHAKSLVAKVRIPKGTEIRAEMLTLKSPGTGLKPALVHKVVGRIARSNIEPDTVLPSEVLDW